MLEAARDLYALAPAEFTAARNLLAKELKAAGADDDAQVVARLRKPRLAEWALNRLARHDRAIVDRFASAIATAQQAQAAAIGGDGGDIRGATAELRHALAATTDAAVRAVMADRGNGEAQRDDVTAILRGLVSAADATVLLAGAVGSQELVTSGEFFPGAPAQAPHSTDAQPPATSSSKRGSKRGSTPGSTPGSTRAGSGSPTLRASDLVADVARPTTDRPTSATTMAVAAARQAMSRAQRHGLQQAVAAADRALAAARAGVEAATVELTRLTTEQKSAETTSRMAASALEAFDNQVE